MALNLHPDDYLTFMKVTLIGREIARDYGLKLARIEPFPGDVMQKEYEHGIYGRCYCDTGVIHLAIRYRSSGVWLGRRPDADIFKTLAHELAHLRYPHHRATFWKFFEELKAEIDRRR